MLFLFAIDRKWSFSRASSSNFMFGNWLATGGSVVGSDAEHSADEREHLKIMKSTEMSQLIKICKLKPIVVAYSSK